MKRLILILVIGFLGVQLASAQESTTLEYGDSYTDEFTGDNTAVTVGFNGMAGDVIYINVLDGPVPVNTTLYSPGGGQLATSEETMIRNIELGTGGRYTIELMRPEWSSDEGEFTIHLGRYNVDNLRVEDDTLIYEGNLIDAGAMRQFTVDFNEGDLATVMLYGVNVSLRLESPQGEELVYEGVYDDPLFPLYRFPTTGTYTITVQTAEPAGTDISLYVFKREPVPVSVNEPVSGELQETLPTVFTFESPAGKMWDINATLPQNGDPYMAVYQFDGRPYWDAETHNDWGTGPNGQPRIRPFIPATDGTHYIALWYDDWDTEYDVYPYELTVSPSTLLSLPNDSPLSGEITTDSGRMQYAYEGRAGDTIRVTLTRLSKEGQPALYIYSTEDEIVTFNGRNVTRSSFDIELPLDGFYEFVILNIDYETNSTLEYEIRVESVSE